MKQIERCPGLETKHDYIMVCKRWILIMRGKTKCFAKKKNKILSNFFYARLVKTSPTLIDLRATVKAIAHLFAPPPSSVCLTNQGLSSEISSRMRSRSNPWLLTCVQPLSYDPTVCVRACVRVFANVRPVMLAGLLITSVATPDCCRKVA